ncbi:MAG TPA: protease SohB [Candidatus Acidoferrales bacterium]|nr:protease SohB [Candidatus Acidoferrales bacterium]
MWTELLGQYALFAAKLITVVLGAIALIVIAAGQRRRYPSHERGQLQFEHLNRHYERLRDDLRRKLQPDKKNRWQRLREHCPWRSRSPTVKPVDSGRRIFVLNFHGDLQASATTSLREEISALLQVADSRDEVVVRLESSGGLVHAYGLAASQLQRLRDRGLTLTICVDKIAASGGYMMACVGQRIVAAPFAIIGSIGVVAQLPNLHRLLQRRDVDIELHTAGEFKRTLTVLGENTPEGREKFRQELDETHALFKQFVRQHRNRLDIDRVATGEHWYGTQALELRLVDEIATSDDYLLRQLDQAQIYRLQYRRPQPATRRLVRVAGRMADGLISWIIR